MWLVLGSLIVATILQLRFCRVVLVPVRYRTDTVRSRIGMPRYNDILGVISICIWRKVYIASHDTFVSHVPAIISFCIPLCTIILILMKLGIVYRCGGRATMRCCWREIAFVSLFFVNLRCISSGSILSCSCPIMEHWNKPFCNKVIYPIPSSILSWNIANRICIPCPCPYPYPYPYHAIEHGTCRSHLHFL